MVEEIESSGDKEVIKHREIVVTGLGMITPLGLDVKTSWKNLIAGESGVTRIELPYTDIKVAGVVQGFDPKVALEGFVLPKHFKRISRSAQFSLAAAIEACRDAGLLNGNNKFKEGIDPNMVGITIGTGIGGGAHISDVNERIRRGERINPSDALIMEPERVASVPSMKLGAKGPVETVSAACASGNRAIANGYKDIYMGDADIMIVGGAESMLDPGVLEAFFATGALANETDPKEAHRASRPFDKKRKGFVMAEGAAIIVLEEKEHAIKRGAKILAELVGYGNTADAGSDTDPSGEGAERAMKRTIKRAGGLPSEGIVYVHGHGTGTLKDAVEMGAIRNIIVNNYKDVAVSSTKGATGHLVGAAGAAGAIFSILAMREGILPPTINLEDPMDEALGINLVPNKPQKLQEGWKISLVIGNSLGFGGLNSVIGFRMPKKS